MRQPHPQFIEFETNDGLTLPGLIYEPKKPKAAAIFLHGNGSTSVFYDEKDNHHLAAALNKRGISILYFNNRGAHIVKKLNVKIGADIKRKRFGMAHEKIKECLADIDGAVACLKQRGYRTFYLIGESTGANKICVYNFYQPKNDIAKYVLLCGGDDTGFYYHVLGKKIFWQLLAKAKHKLKHKQRDDIATEMLPRGDLFSYEGFYDLANPDGDYNVFPFLEATSDIKLSKKPLFRHFRSIKKPSLVIYGDQDEYAWGDVSRVVATLKKHRPALDYRIIKGANHAFQGHEHDLAEQVAEWLTNDTPAKTTTHPRIST